MADGRVNQQWRDPPGWSAAIERVAALSFDAPLTANQIVRHFARLEQIICEELPDSDERTRLLARLVDLEGTALVEIGAFARTVH
jgi:hypothetical protein